MTNEMRLLNVREVAERLGVSRSFVYALCARRLLESVKVGRALRIPMDGLREFVDGRRRKPNPRTIRLLEGEQ